MLTTLYSVKADTSLTFCPAYSATAVWPQSQTGDSAVGTNRYDEDDATKGFVCVIKDARLMKL